LLIHLHIEHLKDDLRPLCLDIRLSSKMQTICQTKFTINLFISNMQVHEDGMIHKIRKTNKVS